MSELFDGRKEIDKIHLKLKRGKVDVFCRVWERWNSINSAIARCGNEASFTIKRRVGLSETNSILIEKQLCGSVGYKGIAEIKAGVVKKLKKEVKWEVSTEREINYKFIAPKYGKRIEHYYQLTRDFHIKCLDDRPLRQGFDGIISEHCNSFDCHVQEFQFDPICGKAKKPPEGGFNGQHEGIIQLDLGQIRGEFGFYRSGKMILLDFGNKKGLINMPDTGEYPVIIPTHFLPESLTFLGGIKDTRLFCIAKTNLVHKRIEFSISQNLSKNNFRRAITISEVLPNMRYRPPTSGTLYEDAFKRSINDPESFWGEAAEDC